MIISARSGIIGDEMKEKTVHLWNGRIEEIECGQKVKNPVVLTILSSNITCQKCLRRYRKYEKNFQVTHENTRVPKSLTPHYKCEAL